MFVIARNGAVEGLHISGRRQIRTTLMRSRIRIRIKAMRIRNPDQYNIKLPLNNQQTGDFSIYSVVNLFFGYKTNLLLLNVIILYSIEKTRKA